jgi:hypothetical protein
MAVEVSEYGCVTLTGEHIALYRLKLLHSGLKMQVDGIRLSGKFSSVKVAKQMGFTGRTAKALLADMEKKYPMLVRHPNVQEN